MALAVCAVLFTWLPVSAVLAAETNVPLTLQIPSSGIYINKVDFSNEDVFSDGPGSYTTPYECISFTNGDARVATAVVFDFAWAQANGMGENDELDLASANEPQPYATAPGNFAPRVRTGMLKGRPTTGYCRTTDKGVERGKPAGNLVVFVAAVQYQDGSWWHLVPPVDGDAVNDPRSPVSIATVETDGSSAPQECATVENISNKPIEHVQITFRHVGLDGTVLGNEALDVHANVVAGAVLKNSCRGFTGAIDPGLRAYAEMVSQGSRPPAPRFQYRNHYSTLSAFVSEVDFADGMRWRPT